MLIKINSNYCHNPHGILKHAVSVHSKNRIVTHRWISAKIIKATDSIFSVFSTFSCLQSMIKLRFPKQTHTSKILLFNFVDELHKAILFYRKRSHGNCTFSQPVKTTHRINFLKVYFRRAGRARLTKERNSLTLQIYYLINLSAVEIK